MLPLKCEHELCSAEHLNNIKENIMGLSGISPMSLVLILAIVIVLFGTKRVRTLGQDLGEALKGFREGMSGTGDDHKKKEEA
jgi:sec-independent protein translocase protein TatA